MTRNPFDPAPDFDPNLATARALAVEALAAALADEDGPVSADVQHLAAMLCVATDEQRMELFGRLQRRVGRDHVNEIWYAAVAAEKANPMFTVEVHDVSE